MIAGRLSSICPSIPHPLERQTTHLELDLLLEVGPAHVEQVDKLPEQRHGGARLGGQLAELVPQVVPPPPALDLYDTALLGTHTDTVSGQRTRTQRGSEDTKITDASGHGHNTPQPQIWPT